MSQEASTFDTSIPTDSNPYQSGQSIHTKKTNGMAIAGFVFGILSVTIGCLCCPLVFSIPGLIFSLIGRKQIKESGEDGQGMATAGLVLSIISTILLALVAFIYIVLIAMGMVNGDMSDFQ